MVRVQVASLKRTKWWEYALRFVFGGVVTVLAGLVAKKFGPAVGGLFLAFPSILPASLTLLASHRGRDQARADARGAAVGSLGLLAFAAVVALLVNHLGHALLLAAALVAWIGISVVLWLALVARRGEDPV
jgi:uncharacterized membrane protein (GlpM family)